MTDAQKVIAGVLRGAGVMVPISGVDWRAPDQRIDALAAEIDKALGGLTRAWAAVLPDNSHYGPYHELYSDNARKKAEADVAEYEDAELKARWVSSWNEVQS